jgi:hypothetical protein
MLIVRHWCVQEEILAMVNVGRSSGLQILDQIATYYVQRARIVTKVNTSQASDAQS